MEIVLAGLEMAALRPPGRRAAAKVARCGIVMRLIARSVRPLWECIRNFPLQIRLSARSAATGAGIVGNLPLPVLQFGLGRWRWEKPPHPQVFQLNGRANSVPGPAARSGRSFARYCGDMKATWMVVITGSVFLPERRGGVNNWIR